MIGLVVLAVVVLAFDGWLWRRPPRSISGAAGFLALAETAATLLLPTSRAGYLIYPAVLLLCAWPIAVPAAVPDRLAARESS